jgi:hypothetical protein
LPPWPSRRSTWHNETTFDARGCGGGRATWARPPRFRSDLLFSGFAGVPLGTGRTRRTRRSCGSRRSCGPRRTCRSGRSGWSRRSRKAAVSYHHFSLILAGGDFDDASGGKLSSNPTKPSSRTALDLYCFAWIDFELNGGLPQPSNPSDDHQLATRYGGSRDKNFCTRIFAPCDHTDRYNSGDGAAELCEHGDPLHLLECQIRSPKHVENKSAAARADSPKRQTHASKVSASHRHDVPSATSDVLSATSNPNDGDGYACGDAGGPSPLASPPLCQA